MQDLTGKTVLVVGGSSGIGLAIGEAFAREGCRVVLAGGASLSVASPMLYRRCDATHRSQVGELAEWVERESGPVESASVGLNVPTRWPSSHPRISIASSRGKYHRRLQLPARHPAPCGAC